jgi:hypothetical protein
MGGVVGVFPDRGEGRLGSAGGGHHGLALLGPLRQEVDEILGLGQPRTAGGAPWR